MPTKESKAQTALANEETKFTTRTANEGNYTYKRERAQVVSYAQL